MVQKEQRKFKLKAFEFYRGHEQGPWDTWPRFSAHGKMGKVAASLEQGLFFPTFCAWHGQSGERPAPLQTSEAETEW